MERSLNFVGGSVVTTPTELIKIRQQTLSKPSTARAVALQMIKQGGIRALYRGLSATALRDFGYGAYFAAVNDHHSSFIL
jgi:solute carrier family 25 carnitine/acylcarnitine transporter 20/29